MTAAASAPAVQEPFWHAALLYADDDEYLAGTVPFIEEGLAADEPVLVAVPAAKLALLQPQFDASRAGRDLLAFAPMEDMGRNPAWIIPAWADFMARRQGNERARGIGEPIWSARSDHELVECVRHEELLNLAFGDAAGFALLCPYDTSSLDPSIIEGTGRTHPHVRRGDITTASTSYEDPVATLADRLPPVPPAATLVPFVRGPLGAIRLCIAAAATAAGVRGSRVDDVVLAVSEAVANSMRHGGGVGRLAMWHDLASFVCEIRDGGRIADALAGRVRPKPDKASGRGLWIMTQLCDLVQIRSLPDGQVIRLHVTT